ncbi:MAG: hypothetical protein CEN88_248 [Candidatus Berkelbacteria bacterium Licking1014_2]|uniref:Uncharacterized protein n=1 Tax=Candidatus Berkelbacteria bacterium Licking1014_2 TaxID=2017146 RepID=A0A554LVP8_9BACT|nr:MAG: hypothetical protein CEN88_248 [Candidatus Berkelbacteria bacterium Licking1014_2]
MSIEGKSQLDRDRTVESRTLHDAGLIEGGAKFESGVLQPTDEQIENMKAEMERDFFSKTKEGKADQVASNTLHAFFRILTSRIDGEGRVEKGQFKIRQFEVEGMSEEDLRDFYREAATRIGFGPEIRDFEFSGAPERNKAIAVRRLIIDHIGLFKSVFREAINFSLIGQDVEILRSDGRFESGWKVANYDKNDGHVRVEDQKRGLYKKIPLYSLVMLNSALFEKQYNSEDQ